MSDEIAFLSATELLRLFAAKALSPIEATKAALADISKHNAAQLEPPPSSAVGQQLKIQLPSGITSGECPKRARHAN